MSRNRTLLVSGAFILFTAAYVAFVQEWMVSGISSAVLSSDDIGSGWWGPLLAVFLESVSFGLPFAVSATLVVTRHMTARSALVAPLIGVALPLAVSSVWHAVTSGSWMPRMAVEAALSNTSQLTADAAGVVLGISLVVLAAIGLSDEHGHGRRSHGGSKHTGVPAAS